LNNLLALQTARRFLETGRAKEIRETARLSQAEVAEALGVRQCSISFWESGRHVPRRETALRYHRLMRAIERREGAGGPKKAKAPPT